MSTRPIYEKPLNMVYQRLVMKCAERTKAEGTMVIHGGGMRRWRKQSNKKEGHKKRCAKIGGVSEENKASYKDTKKSNKESGC